MEEYERHVYLGEEIYILGKQVNDLIEQTHKLKCVKNQFRNPYDLVPYTKFLFLDRKKNSFLSVYPCLFKSCMESVVNSINYNHPSIRPCEVYYSVYERVHEDDIHFFRLSREPSYTEDDIKIIRGVAERVLRIMESCIVMYTRPNRGYMAMMTTERDRVKKLLE